MTPEEADKLRFWLKEVVYAPQYAGRIISAVPALLTSLEACQSKDRELAEEFRRLAAEAVENREKFRETQESYLVTFYNGMRVAYHRAAQMLEEKLNG